MRVTFDSNTLEKAARPGRSPRDPDQPSYVKVHQAVVGGRIKGYFAETIITLEGIQKADRAAVFGSTTLTGSEEITESPEENLTKVKFTLVADNPLRKPLHPEVRARITAARNIGMRLLRAPRMGGLLIKDPDGTVYIEEADEAATGRRVTTFHSILRELDARQVGFAQVKQLAARFAARDNVTEPWYQSLQRAADVHEQNAVQRAVAEWADGDSIAAHIAYGLDYFCTGDEGKSSGSASVFDASSRAWLTSAHGVQFVTMIQLAGMVN
jgi:hypothetical protein